MQENEKGYTPPYKVFNRKVRLELKEKGIIIGRDDLQIIIQTVFDVITKEYFMKFKNLTIKNFGSFSVKTIRRNFFLNGEIKETDFVSYKFNINRNTRDANKKRLKEALDE